jgi:hypothetical protein
MDPATTFYQALAGISFTLLGLWFGVVQFAHGGWRTNPQRHRASLHVALHFFLPGMASLASMLGAGNAGGLLWRITFVVAGLIGFVEAASYVRDPEGSKALANRALRTFDPVLYATMIAVAFVPPGIFALTPLQLAGMATGGLFLIGLCFVWLAFAEPQNDAAEDPGDRAPLPIPRPSRQSLTRPDPASEPPRRPGQRPPAANHAQPR